MDPYEAAARALRAKYENDWDALTRLGQRHWTDLAKAAVDAYRAAVRENVLAELSAQCEGEGWRRVFCNVGPLTPASPSPAPPAPLPPPPEPDTLCATCGHRKDEHGSAGCLRYFGEALMCPCLAFLSRGALAPAPPSQPPPPPEPARQG
mgnify:CR=1 FL=1